MKSIVKTIVIGVLAAVIIFMVVDKCSKEPCKDKIVTDTVYTNPPAVIVERSLPGADSSVVIEDTAKDESEQVRTAYENMPTEKLPTLKAKEFEIAVEDSLYGSVSYYTRTYEDSNITINTKSAVYGTLLSSTVKYDLKKRTKTEKTFVNKAPKTSLFLGGTVNSLPAVDLGLYIRHGNLMVNAGGGREFMRGSFYYKGGIAWRLASF